MTLRAQRQRRHGHHAGLCSETDRLLHAGGYPRIHSMGLDPASALGDYFETYVERDLRALIELRDLHAFRRFVRLRCSPGRMADGHQPARADCRASPGGNLFENLMVMEFVEHAEHRGTRARSHFWRDSNGQEIDLLVENGMAPGALGLVEIKSGQTFAADWLASLRRVAAILERNGTAANAGVRRHGSLPSRRR